MSSGRLWCMWISKNGLRVFYPFAFYLLFFCILESLDFFIVSWICSFCMKDCRFLMIHVRFVVEGVWLVYRIKNLQPIVSFARTFSCFETIILELSSGIPMLQTIGNGRGRIIYAWPHIHTWMETLA